MTVKLAAGKTLDGKANGHKDAVNAKMDGERRAARGDAGGINGKCQAA